MIWKRIIPLSFNSGDKMNYCVIDTERIKGDCIYLFSYQIYDENYTLIESKTFQDVSIDLSNRKAPKTKTKKLDKISIKVNSFEELYKIVNDVMFMLI